MLLCSEENNIIQDTVLRRLVGPFRRSRRRIGNICNGGCPIVRIWELQRDSEGNQPKVRDLQQWILDWPSATDDPFHCCTLHLRSCPKETKTAHLSCSVSRCLVHEILAVNFNRGELRNRVLVWSPCVVLVFFFLIIIGPEIMMTMDFGAVLWCVSVFSLVGRSISSTWKSEEFESREVPLILWLTLTELWVCARLVRVEEEDLFWVRSQKKQSSSSSANPSSCCPFVRGSTWASANQWRNKLKADL